VLEVAEELSRWVEGARTFAVATVVAVSGHGPRVPGASLAVDAEGTVIGSVCGGCREGAVHELCRKVLADGESVLERFRYGDEDAFAVGVIGGGFVDVLVTPVLAGTPVGSVFRSAVLSAARGEPVALARVVSGPAGKLGAILLVRPDGSYEGGLGGPAELDRAAAAEARALLRAGRGGTLDLSVNAAGRVSPRTRSGEGSLGAGGLALLVEADVPPP
jgi:xanthine dehydrogenase accessory factor